MLQSYCLETQDTELLLVCSPLLPEHLSSGTPGGGTLGADMGLPMSSQVVRTGARGGGGRGGGRLSPQALEF